MKLPLAAILVLTAGGSVLFAQVAPPPSAPNDGGPEAGVVDDQQTLTSGPIHEAFAAPYSGEPEAGVVVDKQPPEPIDEIPPEYVPEGDNVEWIPGYWGWEPRYEDFVWISGVWRNIPPGQTWVPGYWTQVTQGFQWVSGFWQSNESSELVYLPYPPESLEQGPTSPSPDGDYFWIPGCWQWSGNDYRWRPGYWAPAHENWVWIPSHYTWTPYGCVYINGFWDFQLSRRGVLFAPVHLDPVVYRRPGFRYSPSYVIQVTLTIGQWFVSPRAHHYYFGNYFDRDYGRYGLRPWYTFAGRRNAYDPLLNYYSWYYGRQNVDFTDRLRGWHTYYQRNERARPPATLRAQREWAERQDVDARDVSRYQLARSIQDLTRGSEDMPFQFTRVDEDRRQQWRDTAQAFRQRAQERRDFEPVRAEATDQAAENARQAVRKLQLQEIPGVRTGGRRDDGDRPNRFPGRREQGDNDAKTPTPPPQTEQSKKAEDIRRDIERRERPENKQEQGGREIVPGVRVPEIPGANRGDRKQPGSEQESRRGEPRGFDPSRITPRNRPETPDDATKGDQRPVAPPFNFRRQPNQQRPDRQQPTAPNQQQPGQPQVTPQGQLKQATPGQQPQQPPRGPLRGILEGAPGRRDAQPGQPSQPGRREAQPPQPGQPGQPKTAQPRRQAQPSQPVQPVQPRKEAQPGPQGRSGALPGIPRQGRPENATPRRGDLGKQAPPARKADPGQSRIGRPQIPNAPERKPQPKGERKGTPKKNG